jgi:hypothetical protein
VEDLMRFALMLEPQQGLSYEQQRRGKLDDFWKNTKNRRHILYERLG